jgi:hypothetical protein
MTLYMGYLILRLTGVLPTGWQSEATDNFVNSLEGPLASIFSLLGRIARITVQINEHDYEILVAVAVPIPMTDDDITLCCGDILASWNGWLVETLVDPPTDNAITWVRIQGDEVPPLFAHIGLGQPDPASASSPLGVPQHVNVAAYFAPSIPCAIATLAFVHAAERAFSRHACAGRIAVILISGEDGVERSISASCFFVSDEEVEPEDAMEAMRAQMLADLRSIDGTVVVEFFFIP